VINPRNANLIRITDPLYTKTNLSDESTKPTTSLTGDNIADVADLARQKRTQDEALVLFSHSGADAQPLSNELDTKIPTCPTTCGIC
jgi:hypothetical protein